MKKKTLSLMIVLIIILQMMSMTVVFCEKSEYSKVVFGKTDKCENMTVISELIPVERDGRVGRITSMAQEIEYIHCNVSDSFLYNIPEYTPIEITVEYYDQGKGSFALNYDTHNPDSQFGEWNDTWGAAEIVRLENTNTWKSYTYHIEDMKFTNATNMGGDFRVGVWDPYMSFSSEDVIFGSITVKKAEYLTPIKFDGMKSQRVGNLFSLNDKIILSQTIENKTEEQISADYTYSVFDADKKLIFTGQAETTLGAKEVKEVFVEIENPNIYGIYDIEIKENTVSANNTTEVIYNSAFSVVKLLNDAQRNPRSGVCQQVVGGNLGDASEVSELMEYSGIGVIRDEIRWDVVEKSPGVYEIPKDKLEKINTITESGADVMLILCFWNPLYDGGFTPHTDDGIKAFADYAAFLAKKFKGKVKYFEVWNEYNAMPLFNNGYEPPETYAKMLKATYTAIKEVNEDAIVIGLDTGDISIEFAKRVFDAGAFDYCDAVSVHPYDYESKFREKKLLEDVTEFKALMREYGDEKPIYFTEVGWPTFLQDTTELPSWAADAYGYSHEEQAATQVLVHAYSEAHNMCELITQYCLYDRDNDNEIETTWGIVNSWVDQNDPPNGVKPAFLSLAVFNDFTGAHGEFKEIIEDDRFYAFRYYNNKYQKDVMLLQSGEGEKIQSFDLGCASVELYDMYGNYKTAVYSDTGVYSLSINEVPYYVLGNFKSFRISETSAEVKADATVKTCTIEDTVAFKFEKHSNKNLIITMREHDDVTVLENRGFVGNKAELVLKTDKEASGNEIVTIEILDSSGKVYYSFEHKITIVPPVSITITAEEGVKNSKTHWDVRVVLQNMSNSAVFSGNVKIVNPDYVATCTQERDFTNLKPKEKITYIFNLPERINKRTVNLEVLTVLDNGYKQNLSQQLDFATAIYAKEKPKIDGILSSGEWSGSWIGADELKDIKQISDWGGADDLSFSGTLMWDEENFYFAAIVTDNVMSVKYTPQNAGNMWRGDNIQFGLDDREVIDPVKKITFTEIGLAYVPGAGDTVYRFNSLYELPFSEVVENAKLSVKRYDDYTVYECALPWSEIFYEGYVVDTSKTYHFSVLANDNDTDGRRGWIEYTSGIGTLKDVTQFGTLIFKR